MDLALELELHYPESLEGYRARAEESLRRRILAATGVLVTPPELPEPRETVQVVWAHPDSPASVTSRLAPAAVPKTSGLDGYGSFHLYPRRRVLEALLSGARKWRNH